MPTVDKYYWQNYRILLVVMCSFFVGGVIFVSYFHPKPRLALTTIMNYYHHVYVGIDDSCNLQSSPYLRPESPESPDALQILKYIGLNTIKIRLFNTPPVHESYANWSNVVNIATKIYQQNLNFHLCIFYSDIYSNSKQQTPPKAWDDIVKDQNKLHKQMYDYTFDILSQLKELQILPHIVSIGNEIENGFLLDQNHPELTKCLAGDDCTDIDATWNNFALLLKSAINAIHNVSANIQIMLHSSDAKIANIKFVFIQQLYRKYHVKFDIVGISWSQCKQNNVIYFENVIKDMLTVFDGDDTADLQLMITEFANDNIKCFDVLTKMANSKRLPKFIGVELFDKNGKLFPELGKKFEDNRKLRKLNWTYVFLTIIFLIAIGYNYRFWKKTRSQQQIEFSAIIKKG